jgi:hypothetical protein
MSPEKGAIPHDGAVPRVSEVVDDRTPLTASRIDVAARIGWLLRTHRSVGGLSLRQMSAALSEHGVRLSAPTLSRIESEGHHSAAALDGYAAVLGLPDGALRAPASLICRTFPYAPESQSRPAPRTLDSFSRACEAVDVAAPSGGAWLEFARQHSGEGGLGLPRALMEGHVTRLAHELIRSTGTARFTRQEALVLLRCSLYGDVVDEAVRPITLAPDTQNYWDLLSGLSDRPTVALLEWAASLLSDPSLYRMRGASYALQNMLVVGGLDLDDWCALAPHLRESWRGGETDPARREVLGQLWAALPPPLQTSIRATCSPEATTRPGPRVWSRSRQNQHYGFAESIARSVATRRDHPEEPLLGRLLFEAMFDPRGVRLSNACTLLAVSPFAADLVAVLLEERDRCPDAMSRAAALRVAAYCHAGENVPGVGSLLASGDPTDFEHALTMHARSGRLLPQSAVDRGLTADEMTARRTLYALGLAGDPRLREIADQAALASWVRGGARWWSAQGPRIDD